MRNITVSPETREKISRALAGRKKSYETRTRMSMAKKEEWKRAKAFYDHTTMKQFLGQNNNDTKRAEHEKEM